MRNHISPAAIRKMGLPHRQKENSYLLVMISGDPISYKNNMIYFETGPIKVIIKR